MLFPSIETQRKSRTRMFEQELPFGRGASSSPLRLPRSDNFTPIDRLVPVHSAKGANSRDGRTSSGWWPQEVVESQGRSSNLDEKKNEVEKAHAFICHKSASQDPLTMHNHKLKDDSAMYSLSPDRSTGK
ncbi:hypothetical protein Nepgr_019179 [Nepenthes gracilis]|uniref:Uncharacterized protein n=1 Tax=Nepenthes gracilis TaxID=150966 RepID=A0AAD3XU48_NEPGR|nr:hypothetical protein Nepgr_019179 [Nepenthes gracilis]